MVVALRAQGVKKNQRRLQVLYRSFKTIIVIIKLSFFSFTVHLKSPLFVSFKSVELLQETFLKAKEAEVS